MSRAQITVDCVMQTKHVLTGKTGFGGGHANLGYEQSHLATTVQ